MPQYCAVRFCSESRTGHKFPKNETLSKQWLKAIRRVNFTPSKYSRVCSKHFKPDDYLVPKEPTCDNPPARLKPDVVPSQFPWTKDMEDIKEIMKRKCAIPALPPLWPKIRRETVSLRPIITERDYEDLFPLEENKIIKEETHQDTKIEIEIESLKKDAAIQCSLCQCEGEPQLKTFSNLAKLNNNRKGTLKMIKIEDIKDEPM